jgi:hypothetical protein
VVQRTPLKLSRTPKSKNFQYCQILFYLLNVLAGENYSAIGYYTELFSIVFHKSEDTIYDHKEVKMKIHFGQETPPFWFRAL